MEMNLNYDCILPINQESINEQAQVNQPLMNATIVVSNRQSVPIQLNQNVVSPLQENPPEGVILDSRSNTSSLLDSQASIDTSSKEKPHSAKKGTYEKDRRDDDICPICLDDWSDAGDHCIHTMHCGHSFGLSCLLKWFATREQKTCPICRRKCKDASSFRITDGLDREEIQLYIVYDNLRLLMSYVESDE